MHFKVQRTRTSTSVKLQVLKVIDVLKSNPLPCLNRTKLQIIAPRITKYIQLSTAAPSTSGDLFKWYYIVGITSALIVGAVVVGYCIYRRRRRGEWKCLGK